MPQGTTTAQEAKRTPWRRAPQNVLVSFLAAALCSLLLAVPAAQAGAASARSELGAGSSLQRPAQLFSPAGLYWLTLTGSGNAKLWGPNGTWLWSSNTSGTHATDLVMQTDGNLVLYTPANVPVWSSGTAGNPGSVLALSNTGVLSITSPGGLTLWQTPNGPTGYQMSKLTTNEELLPNQSLNSPSETSTVTLAPGGNVDVMKGSTVTFSSNKSGFCAADLVMQTDGNLVVYCGGSVHLSNGNLIVYSGGSPLWSTGTSGNPGAYAEITDAGQLEVLSASNAVLWPAASPPPPPALAQNIVNIANSQDQFGQAVAETPMNSNCNIYTFALNRGLSAYTTAQGATRSCPLGTRSEAWCADFANWVWGRAGANVSGLDGLAYSFIDYGRAHGTFHAPMNSAHVPYVPKIGDAIVFGVPGTGTASHVGIVTAVRSGGAEIEMTSGNWENAVIDTGWQSLNELESGASNPVIGFASPVPAGQSSAALRSAAVVATAPYGETGLSSSAIQTLINSQDQGH